MSKVRTVAAVGVAIGVGVVRQYLKHDSKGLNRWSLKQSSFCFLKSC